MSYITIGVNNGDAVADVNLLRTQYATDVLKYFRVLSVFKELLTTESIDKAEGKSFPIMGDSQVSEYGASDVSALSARSNKATDRIINITSESTAHEWLSKLDQAMVNYDAKLAKIESMGRTIAKNFDTKAAAAVVLAGVIENAGDAALQNLKEFDEEKFAPMIQISAGDAAIGSKIFEAAVDMVSAWEAAETVGEPVFVFNTPQYFSLLANPAQNGITYVNDPYVQSGKVPQLLGKRVMHTPRFAAAVALANANSAVGVIAAGLTVYGALFSKECAGCLSLMELGFSADQIPANRYNWLLQASYSSGFGVLNHSSCILLVKTIV